MLTFYDRKLFCFQAPFFPLSFHIEQGHALVGEEPNPREIQVGKHPDRVDDQAYTSNRLNSLSTSKQN